MKKMIALVTAAVMVLSMIPVMAINSFAAEAPAIVKDGLVAWYDGSNNSNGEQDYESTVWKDLSGNGHHMNVRLNETNVWTDNAFHVDASSNYFPDALKDLINSDEYTFEFVAGELTYAATHWITLMCSDNDEFSLFVRVPNGEETQSNFEYKYRDSNQDRPVAENGADLVNNSTITVTFDLAERICVVYVNGAAIASGVPEFANIADSLSFGHESTARAWSGDVHAFRFYDRVLTDDEIADNAEADNKKYRSGDYYPPQKEYEGDGETVVGGLEGEFKNDLIPLIPELDLIPPDGFYGTESIIDNFYSYEGDTETWPGVRFVATQEAETNGNDGTDYLPTFYVNYQKYCRMTGLTPLNGEDVNFVVLKIKVEGGTIGDLHMWAMAGDQSSYWLSYETYSIFGSAESTGETEYLIYDLTGAWKGPINMLRFEIEDMEGDTAVYVDEIAFFGTEEDAFAYTGDIYVEDTTAKDSDEPDAEDTTVPSDGTTDSSTNTGTSETDEQTEAPKSGCGSVVGFGAVVVLTAAAAVVALKKKD